MENNIFEGAKFGDRFLTKNNQVARYHGYFHGFHCLNIEGMSRHIKCFENGKSCLTEGPVGSNWSDIISRYQEPNDEDILKESLHKLINKNFWVITSHGDYDYGEQRIEYESDRTHKDSKNVDVWSIIDDFLDCYREVKGDIIIKLNNENS